MNYIKLFLIALALTLISIIRETLYPFMMSNPTPRDHIYIYTIRFIHLSIFLFTSYYLFFGIGNDCDMYLYLITIIIIVICWYVFDGCPVSYMELLFYNVDLENVKTTFHSTFYSLFNDYTRNIMITSGILYLINVSIILYNCKLPKQTKLLYYTLFIILFFDSIYKGIIHTQYYSENKHLLSIHNFYTKYFQIYNEDSQK
jgi:hypothetical protein